MIGRMWQARVAASAAGLVQAADWPLPTVSGWVEAGRWEFEEATVMEYVRASGCR